MAAVVWILGAGFSQSLGGPLMNNLLAPELAEDLAVTYDPATFPKLFDQAARCAHWLHNYGRKFELGEPELEDAKWSWRKTIYTRDDRRALLHDELSGERLWWDPEVYLSALDSAAAHLDGTRAKRLQRALEKFFEREKTVYHRAERPTISQIAAAARRLFAGQTSSFVDALDWDEELCAPYLRWAKELIGPQDYIITFNYDLVPEKISEKTKKLVALLPNEKPSGQCPPVLKLHGSVDWMRTNTGVIARASEHEALICDDNELAIATPGPGKLDVSKLLEPLWGMAENALREAFAVILMGFRFPPADSHARARLLGAISSNRMAGLSARIVLGHKSPDDATRTQVLLRYAMERRQMGRPTTYIEPLLAEDFFTVMERGQFGG